MFKEILSINVLFLSKITFRMHDWHYAKL